MYLNIVFNEDSLSSPTRIAVDGSQKIAGLEATVSTLIESLDNSVGNMLHAITSLRMFWYVFSADVKKCYHQIEVHGALRNLSLIAWYDNLVERKNPVVIMKKFMQFGFNCANGALEMTIAKYCRSETKDPFI